MHLAVASVADILVSVPAQLDKAVNVSSDVIAYVYSNVAFLENQGSIAQTVNFKGHSYSLPAGSSSLVDLSSGSTLFNSVTLAAPSTSSRVVLPLTSSPLSTSNWVQWSEPILSSAVSPNMFPASALFTSTDPLEMTVMTSGLTTFAWYEASGVNVSSSTLTLETTTAQAFVVFYDGQYVGAHYDVSHNYQGNVSVSFPIIPKGSGTGTLTLLSEELGYPNYGFTVPLYKGVVGEVLLNTVKVAGPWKQRSGLAGEHLSIMGSSGRFAVPWTPVQSGTGSTHQPGTWYQISFATPTQLPADAELLLNATGLHRGRVWLNGPDKEIGRYFQLPRNDFSYCPPSGQSTSECATQTYYHIPRAWLTKDSNLLTIFESAGLFQGNGDLFSVTLAYSFVSSRPASLDLNTVLSCEF
jgi:hypothetical protein